MRFIWATGRDLVHFGWWGNSFGIDNMLAFDLMFGRKFLRLGYRLDLRTFNAENLDTQILRNSFHDSLRFLKDLRSTSAAFISPESWDVGLKCLEVSFSGRLLFPWLRRGQELSLLGGDSWSLRRK